jgi:hypothetical protein
MRIPGFTAGCSIGGTKGHFQVAESYAAGRDASVTQATRVPLFQCRWYKQVACNWAVTSCHTWCTWFADDNAYNDCMYHCAYDLCGQWGRDCVTP